jgi:hypothetical protein
MKKIILGGVAAIVIAALAVVNVNLNSQNDNLLSDIALANVEALAQEVGNSSYCGTLCFYWPTTYCILESSTAYTFCFEKYPR